MSGFYEDERIRHKNREYNQPYVEQTQKPVHIQLSDDADISDVLSVLSKAGYSNILQEDKDSRVITIQPR